MRDKKSKPKSSFHIFFVHMSFEKVYQKDRWSEIVRHSSLHTSKSGLAASFDYLEVNTIEVEKRLDQKDGFRKMEVLPLR